MLPTRGIAPNHQHGQLLLEGAIINPAHHLFSVGVREETEFSDVRPKGSGLKLKTAVIELSIAVAMDEALTIAWFGDGECIDPVLEWMDGGRAVRRRRRSGGGLIFLSTGESSGGRQDRECVPKGTGHSGDYAAAPGISQLVVSYWGFPCI